RASLVAAGADHAPTTGTAARSARKAAGHPTGRDEKGDSAMFERLRHHILDHSPAELLRYCLTAMLLADALELPPGEEVRLIAIAGRLRCNGFAVSVRESSDASHGTGSVVSYELARVGTAVYLACSNLNHSCSPGASVAFAQPTEGNRSAAAITVRTTRSHAPDEEICISYGPVAVEVGNLPGKSRFVGDVCERLRILREKYFFVCTCVACASAPSDKDADRPTAAGDGPAYRCVDYSKGISRCEAVVFEEDSRCPKCGNPVDLEKRAQAGAGNRRGGGGRDALRTRRSVRGAPLRVSPPEIQPDPRPVLRHHREHLLQAGPVPSGGPVLPNVNRYCVGTLRPGGRPDASREVQARYRAV
ncbi:MAG: hypothetical protein BJ554DRAFT_2371, partial [Olpidium bornovanus]